MSSKIERKCSVEGCREIGTLHCKGCLIKFYCGKECQTRDWSQHKGGCKEIAAMNKKKAEDELAVKLAHNIQTLCAAGCGEEALERCSLCAGAKYCGRKCQKKHWPEHKELCKLAAFGLAKEGGDVDKFDKKVALFKRLAEDGDLPAQCMLGGIYFSGIGVSEDHCEAFKWYKRAAESGHKDSMYFYGSCYFFGNGVSKDEHEAFKWFKRAAESGHIASIYHYGRCYFLGKGVAKNYYEGIKWMTRSGEAGYAEAQFFLGLLYENGDGVTVDMHAAIKWYTLASEAGDLDAKAALARLSKLH